MVEWTFAQKVKPPGSLGFRCERLIITRRPFLIESICAGVRFAMSWRTCTLQPTVTVLEYTGAGLPGLVKYSATLMLSPVAKFAGGARSSCATPAVAPP